MLRFRLQSVLSLRMKKEEEAKLLYAQEVRQHQEELNHLQIIKEDLEHRYQARKHTNEIFSNEERILFLKESIENQKKRILAAEKKMILAHAVYMKKHQETQVIEKIKEKHEEREKKRARKKELKTLDSLYTMRFSKNNGDKST